VPAALIWSLPFVWALLFWASYHPLDLGFLGWVQLVPLLVFARSTKGWKSFWVAWLAGAIGHGAGFFWVRFTVPPGPYLLGALFGFYVSVFVVLARRLGPIWTPAIWTALEFLRGHLFSGMPWLLLGYTQHQSSRVIQIADLGGVWLVTILVALVNGALVDGRRAARWTAAGAVLLSFVYGALRLPTIELEEGPRLALVQPNIPQDLKLIMRDDPAMAFRHFERHLELTRQARELKPDLVVWPEASIYRGVFYDAVKKEWLRNSWHARILEGAETAGVPYVMGLLMTDHGPRGRDVTNTALLVEPGKGIVGRYDKIRLVPFAEFSPFARFLPFVDRIVKAVAGFVPVEMRPGLEVPLWEAVGTPYGAQICFDAIFPEISREIAGKGARFTVNISNDGWFRDSAELDQMQVMSRFRAIENRIGFVRATNTGISAFIAPTGREDRVLEVGGRRKEVGGVLDGRVATTRSGSLYRAWGDWAAWGAVGAALAGLAGRILVDRRRRRL
jgi:apolipoprotein N-acyltransferase